MPSTRAIAYSQAIKTLAALRDRARDRPLDYLSWTPPQEAYLRSQGETTLLRTGNQFGKGHSNTTPILTPDGWRPIGSLRVGDQVIAGDGSATTVTGVYPRGRLPLLLFVFEDGASVDCTYDHLWVVRDHTARFHKESPRYGQWRVMEAQDILDRWGPNPRAPYRVSIPVVGRSDGERVLHHIEGAGEEESVCISVAHTSQTYVTKDYIVTHNTYAGAAETIYRCLGEHPFKPVSSAPIEAWVICSSWSQSISIQGKLWALLPKDQLTPDCRFSARNGFIGVQKAVTFKNGSIIRIKTSGQDTLDLASATIHWLWIDEPLVDAEVFSELQARLRRTGGKIGITMTPAVTGDLTWLREAAQTDRIIDLHYRMEPQNFIPVGKVAPLTTEDGTPMDQAWIDRQIADTLPWARPVRCHGEWEYARTERVFENFHDHHTIVNLPASSVAPIGDVKLSLGVDYGEERLRTVAVLVAVDDTTDPESPKVYILGEYAPDTASTIKMDAKGILAMISSLGFRWSDLDFAWGDKRYTDSRGRITRKSNAMMTEAIERELGKKRGIRPAFRGAKRGIGGGKGSVWQGVRWLNDRMITPGAFYVDKGAKWTIECLQKWDGTSRSKYKDATDGLRYALRPWIYPRRRTLPTTTTFR